MKVTDMSGTVMKIPSQYVSKYESQYISSDYLFCKKLYNASTQMGKDKKKCILDLILCLSKHDLIDKIDLNTCGTSVNTAL